ncbi:protein-disulfide reductase DsbD N-terminal domain-containing protein [bacterium]|nr:protein-disulfide reductase DsbD N-terminal domain-containing protein [bacterium]
MFTLLILSAFAAPPPAQLTIEGVRAAKLAPGQMGKVVVEASIKQGFHIQANPASMPRLIPTKVNLVGGSEIEVGKVVYPKSQPYKVAGLESAVATYAGRVEFEIPVTVAAGAKAGKRELDGDVRYQACDDKLCFPPTRAVFKAPVEVTP